MPSRCSVCEIKMPPYAEPRFWVVSVRTMWMERNIQAIEIDNICADCVVEIIKMIVAMKESKIHEAQKAPMS